MFYSFGMILWELLTEKTPFEDKGIKDIGKLSFAIVEGVRPDIPKGCPPTLATLITRCFSARIDERPAFIDLVKDDNKIFNDILLEAITNGNEESLNLWRSFPKNEQGKDIATSVPWDTFIIAFLNLLKVKVNDIDENLEIECVKMTLGVTETNKDVTLKNFEKFFKLFPPVNKGPDYLHQIKELLKAEWFYGDIDPDEATSIINNSKKDCFMVRFSTHSDEFYTISYKKGKNIFHTRVPKFDIHGQIKSFRKKHHMKPVSAQRPYNKLFDEKLKNVQFTFSGYDSNFGKQNDMKEERLERKKKYEDQLERDLDKSYTTLSNNTVNFIS